MRASTRQIRESIPCKYGLDSSASRSQSKIIVSRVAKAGISASIPLPFRGVRQGKSGHIQKRGGKMKLGSMAFAAVAVLAIASAIGFSSAANSAPAVGVAAPDFPFNSQEGKPVNLPAFKGRCGGLISFPKHFTTGLALAWT